MRMRDPLTVHVTRRRTRICQTNQCPQAPWIVPRSRLVSSTRATTKARHNWRARERNDIENTLDNGKSLAGSFVGLFFGHGLGDDIAPLGAGAEVVEQGDLDLLLLLLLLCGAHARG
jgi:hypothetical protein